MEPFERMSIIAVKNYCEHVGLKKYTLMEDLFQLDIGTKTISLLKCEDDMWSVIIRKFDNPNQIDLNKLTDFDWAMQILWTFIASPYIFHGRCNPIKIYYITDNSCMEE